jgi:hypothetical protein
MLLNMLRRSVQSTLAISLSPKTLTLYLIPNGRKKLPAIQKIDNTFFCKELAAALWYPWEPERMNLTGAKRWRGNLPRNSLILRREVLELEEAWGTTLRILAGPGERFSLGHEKQAIEPH